jgi:N6-adenosine-specific RNA methylase IME4
MAQFSIIYADPPWEYNNRISHKKTRFGNGADGHYSKLTMAEIRALPIGDLAAKDCALYLWVTYPNLEEQLPLFRHWGFRYCTLGFSWRKLNARDGQPCFGTGYYAKANEEVCLLGMRGQLVPITNRVSSAVDAPRQEHSRKPDAVRDRIVQMYGDVPRVELFARQTTPGWVAVGNGIDGQDIRESLAHLIASPTPAVVERPAVIQSIMNLEVEQ